MPPVTAAGREPSRVLSDTGIVFGRYLRQTLRSRIGLVFGLLQPLLFLVLFGPLLEDVPLGGRGDSWQVLVPGLLVQLGLFSAAFAGFGILVEKQTGVVERMRVTPVSRLALLLGRVLRDVLVLLVQSLLLVLVGTAFGLRAPVPGVVVGFLFTGLLALSLASLSYALAMRVDTPQEFAPVVNAVNLPAVLLSGVLLPMSLAPAWLDAVSRLVPFRYVVDAVRAAYVGDYGDGTVLLGAAVAAALAAVSVTAGTHLFRRAGA
ncbi:MAG TPA: ABC transporter permease [Streptomyces sp.]|uniref:ABC transporter permease n=1 Tax=Streptomyces sp. TaxID=1931 RepID=UPI002D350A90|nr:ABC transporter permease [Streptomyces sp.]HZG03491.1 ABC transporter permease [Streptomyces sp.]